MSILSFSDTFCKNLSAKKSTISLGVSCFLNPVSQMSVNKGSKTPVLSIEANGSVINTLL